MTCPVSSKQLLPAARPAASLWGPVVLAAAVTAMPAAAPAAPPPADLQAAVEGQAALAEAMRAAADNVPASRFEGRYLRAGDDGRFRKFLRLDPDDRLLHDARGPLKLVFVVYSQPGPGGEPSTDVADWDLSLLERDLSALREGEINVALRYLTWERMLDEGGHWRACERQPRGTALPRFDSAQGGLAEAPGDPELAEGRRFGYEYELGDYLLDRIEAHGLYALAEVSFCHCADGQPREGPYVDRLPIYDEFWEAHEVGYRRVVQHFAQRRALALWLCRGDELALGHYRQDRTFERHFQRFVAEKHMSVEAMKTAWGRGYDLLRPQFVRRQQAGQELVMALYPLTAEVLRDVREFSDVRLPLFDYLRSAQAVQAPFVGDAAQDPLAYATAQQNLLEDPVWIDYMQFRQAFLIEHLNRWVEAMRRAAPNHAFAWAGSPDLCPSWQGVHLHDVGSLRFDLLGASGPASGASDRHCAYTSTVASCAPYLEAAGATARGTVAVCSDTDEARYQTAPECRASIADHLGAGGALVVIDDPGAWPPLDWPRGGLRRSGGDPERAEGPHHSRAGERSRFSPRTGDVGELARDLRRARLMRGPAEVLIMRSQQVAFSNSSGHDFGSARHLASVLRGLGVDFDMLPDADCALGEGRPRGKVDISPYRVILVATLAQDLPGESWRLLGEWLHWPERRADGMLVLGLSLPRGPYFLPFGNDTFGPGLQELIGLQGYEQRREVGDSEVVVELPGDAVGRLHFGPDAQLALLAEGDGECLLRDTQSGLPVAVRVAVDEGTTVVLCGFNLGLVYDPTWGAGPQDCRAGLPRPAGLAGASSTPCLAPDGTGALQQFLARLLEGMNVPMSPAPLRGKTVEYRTPSSEVIVVREIAGEPVEWRASVPRGDYLGPNVESITLAGATTLHGRLAPYETVVVKRD